MARTELRDGKTVVIVRDPDAVRLASGILALLRAAYIKRGKTK